MMELSVTSTSVIEPVTVAGVKAQVGYPLTETTQDLLIAQKITAARQWLEGRTALSVVSKNYRAYFEKDDSDLNGYYELPVSPVTTLDTAYVVSVMGVSTTYHVKGLKVKKIKPDNVIGTIGVGSSTDGSYYVTVDFSAGAENIQANEIITVIAGIMFENRTLEFSESWLPYHTRKMIESISVNVL